MKLKGIDAAGSQGLRFRFDDDGVQREWTFESASLAEFLALLLDGRMRGGRRLELSGAELSLASQPGEPTELRVLLPKIEMAFPLADDQPAALKAELERVVAARNGGAPPTALRRTARNDLRIVPQSPPAARVPKIRTV